MADPKKQKKHKFTFNIGTVIFGAVFIYMVATMIMYFTTDHIQSYMVTPGPLAKNEIYTGIALREEQVVNSPVSGNITYYARDNTKVSKDAPVFAIGSTSGTPQLDDFTETDYSRIRRSMADFASSFRKEDFIETYNYKYQLSGTLLQYSGLGLDIQSGVTTLSGGQTLYGAETDGVILYTLDNYENLAAEDLTDSIFEEKRNAVKNLQGDSYIDAGEPVYKLITSEKWSVVVPVSSEEAVRLGERNTLKVKFLKDGNTQTGNVTISTNEKNEFFCRITFYGGMIRYASDRFLDIELVTNTTSGLKIPLSSVVSKDFYIIPKEYISYREEDGVAGFNKKIARKNEEDTSEFKKVTLYEEDESFYYVDTADFEEGDEIIKPDSQATYTIKETRPLKGVYSMNKGYAIFRKIIIIDQNDEYCIVEVGTPYGLSQFDHIVKDGSAVFEEEVLYK